MSRGYWFSWWYGWIKSGLGVIMPVKQTEPWIYTQLAPIIRLWKYTQILYVNFKNITHTCTKMKKRRKKKEFRLVPKNSSKNLLTLYKKLNNPYSSCHSYNKQNLTGRNHSFTSFCCQWLTGLNDHKDRRSISLSLYIICPSSAYIIHMNESKMITSNSTFWNSKENKKKRKQVSYKHWNCTAS